MALGRDEAERLEATIAASRPGFMRDLEHLVGVDSGSDQPQGVETVARFVMSRLEGLGASVRRHSHADTSDTFVAELAGQANGLSVLLLGHADTVFGPGTAAARPFRVEGPRAYGPGVTDMKSGLLLGLLALTALRECGTGEDGWVPVERLTFVVNPDEEIGSPSSTAVIRDLAATTDVALVLEAARPNGDLVIGRAGMTHLHIEVKGRSAHAGVEPERGRSAVLEAAHKTIALHALNDHAAGLSVTVGTVHGGDRPNIVPDAASMVVDVRARQRTQQESALARIETIVHASSVQGTSATLERLAHHLPMERTPASERLADVASELAGSLGLSVGRSSTGGASDANTTAALGVPTLDGLGPVGGAAHTEDEYLDLDTVGPRAMLLAGLLLAIGRDPARWRRERRLS